MSIAAIGGARGPVRTVSGHPAEALTNLPNTPDRSTTMYLIHEELARAHIAERQREAERIRRVRRVVVARRAQRKAEKAVLRARVAALAVA